MRRLPTGSHPGRLLTGGLSVRVQPGLLSVLFCRPRALRSSVHSLLTVVRRETGERPQGETGERPTVIERVRAKQERHRQRSRFIRIPFAIAGFAVLLAGVVMLFTPGPGWAVIVFALALLALEFAWAERALERVIDQMERASEQVTKGSPARRAAVISIGVLAAVGFVALIVLWDIPLFPG